MRREYTVSEETYDDLCRRLTEFENSTDDPSDDGYLSDGEWLDYFYDMLVKLQKEMAK